MKKYWSTRWQFAARHILLAFPPPRCRAGTEDCDQEIKAGLMGSLNFIIQHSSFNIQNLNFE
jgi:hypothetical protein